MDGKVDIADVTLIQRAVAEVTKLNCIQAMLADVNCDGRVTVSDATIIQNYLAEYAFDSGRCGFLN